MVLVDADANKNSRSDEDLTLSDPNVKLIPSLVTGDPFTLGEGDTDNINVRFINMVTHNNTIFNVTKTDVPSSIEIQSFSDRALVETTEMTHSDGMLINLGTDMGDLRNTISESDASDDSTTWSTDFRGFNLLNYDLRSFNTDANNIGSNGIKVSVVVTSAFFDSATNHTYTHQSIPVKELSGLQGLELLDDSADVLFDTVRYADELDISILYEWKTDNTKIEQGTYPIVTDFFSFGFSDDGNQAHERVSNQIIRLELEEDADNSGKFVGTLEYTISCLLYTSPSPRD